MNNEIKKEKDYNKSEENIEKLDIEENNEHAQTEKNLDSLEDENIDLTDKEIDLFKQIEELRNEKLRLLAEMENLRKRSDKEKIDSIRYGSISLA